MTSPTLIKSVAPALLLLAAGASHGQANQLVFSLDIGSDTEISDPAGGAGELADPGDVYAGSNVLGSLAGVPHLDDAQIFGGADPAPQQGAAASAVPVGMPVAAYTDYFDLDGYDSVDVRLDQLDFNPDVPLAGPLWRQGGLLACVQRARDLAISFTDDDVTGWRAVNPPRVPTEGPSPQGNVYGTTMTPDEVIGLQLSLAGGYPATVVASAPARSEIDVHVDLGPNPDNAEADDDDVDALDRTDTALCTVHLFSADDEGRLGLNQGWIYQSTPAAAPLPVITNVHLGTTLVTDVDAFELVWLPHPSNGQDALAIVYSVAANDPATAIDESGGLSPSTLYASFMTGASFVFVPGNLYGFDDIDAITMAPDFGADSDGDGIADAQDNCVLVANPDQLDTNGDGFGNVCDQDLNGDCDVTISDLALFRAVFFTNDPDADFNGDGVVNPLDLAYLRANFFGTPGPSGLTDACGD